MIAAGAIGQNGNAVCAIPFRQAASVLLRSNGTD